MPRDPSQMCLGISKAKAEICGNNTKQQHAFLSTVTGFTVSSKMTTDTNFIPKINRRLHILIWPAMCFLTNSNFIIKSKTTH